VEDLLVERVGLLPGHRLTPKAHAKTGADLLENRVRKPGLAARVHHALHAAAPLFDQAQLMEDAADDAVPQLGDAAANVFEGQTWGQTAWVVDLNAVLEDGQAKRRAPLCIVGVNQRVDDRFTQSHQGVFPDFGVPGSLNIDSSTGIALDEVE